MGWTMVVLELTFWCAPVRMEMLLRGRNFLKKMKEEKSKGEG